MAAGFAGSQVTSVDLSNTYLAWAKRNMHANGLSGGHRFFRADVKSWLAEHPSDVLYDLIVLDPPTFSNSKSMNYTFDVKKHHPDLIEQLMPLLTLGGRLVFSTNARSFKLDATVEEKYSVDDQTEKSIPEDFRDRKIHRCFEIKHKAEA